MPDTRRDAVVQLLGSIEGRGLVHYVDLAAALEEKWPEQFGVTADRATPHFTLRNVLDSDRDFEKVGQGVFRYKPWGEVPEIQLQLSGDGGASLKARSAALRSKPSKGFSGAVDAILSDPERRSEEIDRRRAAMAHARSLLDKGELSAADVVKLSRAWSTTGLKKAGQDGFNRFAPAFLGTYPRTYQDNLEAFNEWVGDLWTVHEEGIPAKLDELWSRGDLPLSGTILPSMVLHTRRPDRYFPWTRTLAKGLELSGHGGGAVDSSSEGYLEYCRGVARLLAERQIDPNLADLVLIQEVASAQQDAEPKEPKPKPGESGFQGFGPRAFEILQALLDNPKADKEWFAPLKEDYYTHIRKPLLALTGLAASEVIEPLLNSGGIIGDESIVVDPKRVAAKIVSQSVKRKYWPFLWTAFFPESHVKKNLAVQLFLLLHARGMDVGLDLSTAPEEARERFRRAIKKHADRFEAHIRNQPDTRRFRIRPDDQESGGANAESVVLGTSGELRTILDQHDPRCLVVKFRKEDLAQPRSADAVVDAVRSLVPFFVTAVIDEPGPALDQLEVPLAVEEEEPDEELEELVPTYTLDDLQRDTGLPKPWLENVARTARVGESRDELGQVVLYGPPGTGKTYVAERVARYLVDGDQARVRTVQFHPAYSYEHFVEGYRPEPSRSGDALLFQRVDGVLLEVIDRVVKTGHRHVLIIDEMNRGDLPQVFGELMYLLSRRRRGEGVFLPKSRRTLNLPKKLTLIGTMNTADRSIAHVDFALRRRFRFFEIKPEPEILRQSLLDDGVDSAFAGALGDLLSTVNKQLRDEGGGALQLGHAYFMGLDSATALKSVWEREVLPLVEDFVDYDPDILARYRWAEVKKLLEAFAKEHESDDADVEDEVDGP